MGLLLIAPARPLMRHVYGAATGVRLQWRNPHTASFTPIGTRVPRMQLTCTTTVLLCSCEPLMRNHGTPVLM